MKKSLLLPNSFKKIGWVIFVPAFILGSCIMFEVPCISNISSSIVSYIITNVAIVGTIVGAMFIGFSRERHEDEMIASLRLNALLIATYINYGALVVAALLLYDIAFLNVMAYNLTTLLIIYLVVFKITLYRLNKSLKDEQ